MREIDCIRQMQVVYMDAGSPLHCILPRGRIRCDFVMTYIEPKKTICRDGIGRNIELYNAVLTDVENIHECMQGSVITLSMVVETAGKACLKFSGSSGGREEVTALASRHRRLVT